MADGSPPGLTLGLSGTGDSISPEEVSLYGEESSSRGVGLQWTLRGILAATLLMLFYSSARRIHKQHSELDKQRKLAGAFEALTQTPGRMDELTQWCTLAHATTLPERIQKLLDSMTKKLDKSVRDLGTNRRRKVRKFLKTADDTKSVLVEAYARWCATSLLEEYLEKLDSRYLHPGTLRMQLSKNLSRYLRDFKVPS